MRRSGGRKTSLSNYGACREYELAFNSYENYVVNLSTRILRGARVFNELRRLIHFHNLAFCSAAGTAEGETLVFQKVTRSEMGVYLCIASNGVPPSVLKRIGVSVTCEWNAKTIISGLLRLRVFWSLTRSGLVPNVFRANSAYSHGGKLGSKISAVGKLEFSRAVSYKILVICNWVVFTKKCFASFNSLSTTIRYALLRMIMKVSFKIKIFLRRLIGAMFTKGNLYKVSDYTFELFHCIPYYHWFFNDIFNSKYSKGTMSVSLYNYRKV